MKNISFLDKYRYYIGGFLILLIIAGWVYLFIIKNENHDINNSEELSVLKARVDELNKKVEATTNSGGEVAGAQDKSNLVDAQEETTTQKININTATSSELQAISGIGPARAEDIINYRETNGGFTTTSEIQNIKGIGPATYEKMRDQITIE